MPVSNQRKVAKRDPSSKDLRMNSKKFNDLRLTLLLAMNNVYDTLDLNRDALEEAQVGDSMGDLLIILRATNDLCFEIAMKAAANAKKAAKDSCEVSL